MSRARVQEGLAMIDNFALGLTHGLMLLAAVLLLRRPDLDDESASTEKAEDPAEARRALRRKGRFGA
jgi:hypothetical protein